MSEWSVRPAEEGEKRRSQRGDLDAFPGEGPSAGNGEYRPFVDPLLDGERLNFAWTWEDRQRMSEWREKDRYEVLGEELKQSFEDTIINDKVR